MDFVEFLRFLAFGGGSVMAASFLAERWDYFKSLASEKQQFISFLVSSAIGAGAYATLTYAPIDVINGMTPYFMVVAASFSIYYVGQVFHKEDKSVVK